MMAQRQLPLGRWLTNHAPTCGRGETGLEKRRLRRHAGLVLELALLLVLALLLPRPKRRK